MANNRTVSNYYLVRVDVDIEDDGRIMRTKDGQITIPMTVHEPSAKITPIENRIGETIEKGEFDHGRIF